MKRISPNCLLLLIVMAMHTLSIKAQVLTIDSCLSLARQNNKELRHAELNIEKAQQVKNQAFTNYFPQVKATAIGYHSLHPMVEVGIDDINNASVRDLLTTLYGNYGAALGLDNTISLFQYGYQAGVTALQPVYMGGKIVAGNQLAKVGVEAARLQTQITERDLLEQVEESYWLVVGLTEKQQTLHAVTALLDTIHRTVQSAVGAGLALQTDLLQVELRQSEIHRTQIQLDNGLALAKRALWQAISPTTKYDRRTVDGQSIGCVRSGALSLYVSGSRVCDPEGNSIDAAGTKLIGSAQLISLCCELMMDGTADCIRSGSGYLYTLALDEEGMAALSAAIAPDIKAQSVSFTAGSIEVGITDEGTIRQILVSCTGALHLVLSDASASLSATITPLTREISFSQPALDALKQ